jgi:hypothetical protein
MQRAQGAGTGRKATATSLEDAVPKEHKPNGVDFGRKESTASHRC